MSASKLCYQCQPGPDVDHDMCDGTLEDGSRCGCEDCDEEIVDTCSLCDRVVGPSKASQLCANCASVCRAHGRHEQARLDELAERGS